MIRDVLGIKKRREYSPEELARLQEQGRLLAASQSKQGAGITPPVARETGGPVPDPTPDAEPPEIDRSCAARSRRGSEPAPCCRTIRRGLMADMVQAAAIAELHDLGYRGQTLIRSSWSRVNAIEQAEECAGRMMMEKFTGKK